MWKLLLSLPAWVANDSGHLAATIVGSHDTTAFVSVTTPDHGVVFAVNTVTRQMLWQKDHLRASAVAGDTVLGLTPQGSVQEQVTALSTADGAVRWTLTNLYQTNISPAGPGFVAVAGSDYASGKGFLRLLNAATGTDVVPTDHINTGKGGGTVRTCRYDEVSVTVCADDGASDVHQVIGLDAVSGKVLWQLPDPTANRTAPAVTTVWHGAVYGTTANGPVVLDAKTGSDRENAPGIAPVVVNAAAGLAVDPSGRTVTTYPAIG